MRKLLLGFIFMIGTHTAMAQQQVDPGKLVSVLTVQRNNATDAVAQCSVMMADLQAKVADLEKQLADSKK